MVQKRNGRSLPNPYPSVIEQYPSLVELGPHSNSSSSSQANLPLLHSHPTSDPSHSTLPHASRKGLEPVGSSQPTLAPTSPSSDVPPPHYRATLLPPQRSRYDEDAAAREWGAVHAAGMGNSGLGVGSRENQNPVDLSNERHDIGGTRRSIDDRFGLSLTSCIS